MPVVQKNPYAKVVYFRVAYSATLQNLDVTPGASAAILEPWVKASRTIEVVCIPITVVLLDQS